MNTNSSGDGKRNTGHLSALNDDMEIFGAWLEAGGDPNRRDSGGNSPGHLAADNGCIKTFTLWAASGGNCAGRNDNGLTPGHLAAEGATFRETKNFSCFIVWSGFVGEKLLSDALSRFSRKDGGAGADPNAKNENGWTPLGFSLASLYRDNMSDCVSALLNAGADPNMVCNWGLTPLMLAMKFHQPDIVQMLLDTGADMNASCAGGRTALMTAIEHKRWDEGALVVRTLLDVGADPNAADEKGLTPLMYADTYCPELIQVLLDAGANPNVSTEGAKCRNSFNRHLTPLMNAIIHNAVDVPVLLEAGENPNAANKDGWTPLMFAAMYTPHLIPVLLAAGADPKAKNRDGETAIDIANQCDDKKAVAILSFENSREMKTAVSERLSKMNPDSPKHLELAARAVRLAKDDTRAELVAFIFTDTGTVPFDERVRIFEEAGNSMNEDDINRMLMGTGEVSM